MPDKWANLDLGLGIAGAIGGLLTGLHVLVSRLLAPDRPRGRELIRAFYDFVMGIVVGFAAAITFAPGVAKAIPWFGDQGTFAWALAIGMLAFRLFPIVLSEGPKVFKRFLGGVSK